MKKFTYVCTNQFNTMKKLKLWNGRSHGHTYDRHSVYVAAYSVKHAAELVSIACFGPKFPNIITKNEINSYYCKNAWGDPMEGITAEEPCVYMVNDRIIGSKPFRVI